MVETTHWSGLANYAKRRWLIEWIGPQAETRRNGYDIERQAYRGWCRRLAVEQIKALDLVMGTKAMDRDRALRLGTQFGGQHATYTDCRTGRCELLLVADIEAVPPLYIATKVYRGG